MQIKYFKAQEVVTPEVYKKYGDNSWKFVDKDIRLFLVAVREFYNKPVKVNNWHLGGNLFQRGLRPNNCQLVKDKTLKGTLYLSSHCLGKGIDFEVVGVSSKQVAKDIMNSSEIFHMITRMENPEYTPSWNHVDTIETGKPGITMFNP